MPTFNILGGGPITAASDLGLVQALREDAQQWIPSVSIEDFMEGLAARAKMQNGSVVRTDSVANFIADLKAGGFLTPV
ncbi:hypothetical protein HER32_06610 [Hymenobacter sp. BT18]|uniref:hypothetical protein n=1 Tax=Hymenobacter sp. BT18 TaxID=2835648 RepID=UPI00143E98E9|nr:hypothetical protein [Hymenobacter sp. BT18]QIX60864.1 hypothetical protein HER32_06610 [Hymenobacter sp. BT18]